MKQFYTASVTDVAKVVVPSINYLMIDFGPSERSKKTHEEDNAEPRMTMTIYESHGTIPPSGGSSSRERTMKTNTVALAVLIGILIGIAGARAIQAGQANTKPGYVIAEVEVNDLATMQKYGPKVPETLAPFNHHYLVRSDKIQALEGEPPKGGVVIIAFAFDSVEKGRAWYDSPAYAAIRPLRQRAAQEPHIYCRRFGSAVTRYFSSSGKQFSDTSR